MILTSTSANPFFNLAIEEVLLARVTELEPILFLYINNSSVNMGKNQNPWLECNPEFLKKHNIKLCRRCSGGGTVYHDLGNLNYSFIMPKGLYNEKKQFSIIFDTLNSFNIFPELDIHKSIFIGDYKFSGSAFAKKITGFMHHGTFLVNSNLDLLNEALLPKLLQPIGKAVPSKRSPVINLNNINHNISISLLQNAIIKSFECTFPMYNKHKTIKNLCLKTEIEQKQKFLETWNWVFDKTPR